MMRLVIGLGAFMLTAGVVLAQDSTVGQLRDFAETCQVRQLRCAMAIAILGHEDRIAMLENAGGPTVVVVDSSGRLVGPLVAEGIVYVEEPLLGDSRPLRLGVQPDGLLHNGFGEIYYSSDDCTGTRFQPDFESEFQIRGIFERQVA